MAIEIQQQNIAVGARTFPADRWPEAIQYFVMGLLKGTQEVTDNPIIEFETFVLQWVESRQAFYAGSTEYDGPMFKHGTIFLTAMVWKLLAVVKKLPTMKTR
jgi:hypothetical protein